jgi:hypothetical protein
VYGLGREITTEKVEGASLDALNAGNAQRRDVVEEEPLGSILGTG